MIAPTSPEVTTGVLSADPIRTAAALLSAVGDPVRLTIITVLGDGAACVCRLQDHLDIAANLLSYHLRVLREAGLIEGTRRGRWIDYSLVPGALDRLRAAIPAPPKEDDATLP